MEFKTKVKCQHFYCNKEFLKLNSQLKIHPVSFCSRKCQYAQKRLKCVFQLNATGYRFTKINGKQVFIHRLKIESLLGRKLSIREEVHHVDRNKINNSYINLQLIDITEHRHVHSSNKPRNVYKLSCRFCQKEKEVYNNYIKVRYKGDMSKIRNYACSQCIIKNNAYSFL